MAFGGWVGSTIGGLLGQKPSSGGESQSQTEERQRRAAMTQAERDAEDVNNKQMAAEKSGDRVNLNVNAATAGKPMPGTNFSKTNYLQQDVYEALLKSRSDAKERLSAEVLVKAARRQPRQPTKGNTLETSPLGVQGNSPYSALLGGV